MTAPRYDVCIVSSTSVSTGPRVEKEANALTEAGYRVAVLVCHWSDEVMAWDARLQAGRGWDLHAIDWRVRARKRSVKGLGAILLQRAAKALLAAPLSLRDQTLLRSALSTIACSERVLPLLERALRIPASLYIGHNLGALPVVAAVARMRRARFAFDAEDDHFGELTTDLQRAEQGRIVHEVQRRYLPSAAFVTAASDGIADVLVERYAIARPTTVLNAFPFGLRARLDGARKDRRSAALSLCWYSQTVGLDRGLQDVIVALGKVRGDFELHIRGHLAGDVEGVLRDLARAHGVGGRLYFHPQVHPDELLSRIAEHDVGLALEQHVNDNRLIAVTNKILFYLLAGTAIVATDTPGQRGIAAQCDGAIELYAQGDTVALAGHLQRFLDDPCHLAQRKHAALTLARTRFNAELELAKMLPLVARAVGR